MPFTTAAATAATKAAETSAQGLINIVSRAVHSGATINSLADLSKPARVEPIVIIDKALVHQPYMENLMKYSLSQFAGYYLQAVNILMGVGKINTLKIFDSLNPDRTYGTFSDAVFSKEAYSKGLPSLEKFSQPVHTDLIAHTISSESKDSDPSMSATVANDKLHEVPNLAVGKLLEVKISDPETKKTAALPVLIRLIPAPIDSVTVTDIFTAGGKQSWKHRLFLAKTGQIRFWRDFVLGQDIIDAHFNALVKDKTNVYKSIVERRANNVKKSITTGTVSMGDASNIAIVSSETIKTASRQLYGKIENAAVRKSIFDNSFLIMLLIVDEYYQRVTIYHRGLDISSTYRIDEIVTKERGKGSDIEELFKLFSKQMQSNI